MPRHRVALVYSVIAGVIVLPFVGKLLDTDLWPFSRYYMYAFTKTDARLSLLRVYLIPERDPGAETAMVDNGWLQPFDNSRLSRVLGALRKRSDAPQALQLALADIARRYEARRSAGAHHGPPLRGLRLYETVWQMQPDAGNVDSPEQRTLVAELMRRDGSGPGAQR